MRTFVSVLLAVFVLVSAGGALSDRYQVFSEKKGFMGWGGRTIILLDKEKGDTWRYFNEQWVAVPKTTDEAEAETTPEKAQAKEKVDVKARMEAELSALKAKQDEEIKSLQARQAEETKALIAKLSGAENDVAEDKSLVTTTTTTILKRVNSKNSPSAKRAPQKEQEESPPEWLQE